MSVARPFKSIRAFSRNLSRMSESGKIEQPNAAGPVETSIRKKVNVCTVAFLGARID